MTDHRSSEPWRVPPLLADSIHNIVDAVNSADFMQAVAGADPRCAAPVPAIFP
jgi:hypothetical protein